MIGGVRVDRYSPTYTAVTVGTVATGPQTTVAQSPQTLVNPRAALVWEPSEDQTYYFSYGKSSVPQGTSIVGSPTPITTANQALDPEKSETLEVGAKKSFFNGALGLSGSVFKVLKSNALITDPVSGTATAQSGERDRVQGLEFSATGQITDKWNVLARLYLPGLQGDQRQFLQHHHPGLRAQSLHHRHPGDLRAQECGFSFWSSYKLDELVPGLGIGGGAVYQSKLYVAKHHRRHRAGGHGSVAASPSFRAPWNSMPWRPTTSSGIHFQFNVNNLTDELNYTQSFGNRGTPSAGRTFIVSAGVDL